MTDNVLTSLQKKRLATASQEAISRRQTWHLARITQAPADKLEEFYEAMVAADRRFDQMMAVQGLCVGDLVRIIADGLYKGAVAKIKEIEVGGRLCLNVGDWSVLPFAYEVELAAEITSEKRYNDRKKERKRT